MPVYLQKIDYKFVTMLILDLTMWNSSSLSFVDKEMICGAVNWIIDLRRWKQLAIKEIKLTGIVIFKAVSVCKSLPQEYTQC